MDYNEWREKYKPIESEEDIGDYLLETFGESYEKVKAANPNCVWTLLDSCGSDDGNSYIVSGCHYVNRIAYIITEVPVPEGEFIEVLDD